MIRTDGYYITEGSLYRERNDPNENWSLFIAYLFNSDGTFIKASKFSNSEKTIRFESNEFLLENSNIYKIVENKIYLYFNLGLPWEHNEILEEFNSGDFLYKNGIIIKFQPWNF